jgi:hypothetical protein
LAVEALFQTHQPRSEAADVDVVVKRRRIASTDDRVEGNDVAEVVADEVRAPRLFKATLIKSPTGTLNALTST